MGVDVRGTGSGNIGATNVARSVGAGPGILTLVLDVAKGALPVLLSEAAGATPAGGALIGLATVVGHVFSVFTGFRGGKGVATTSGVFLVLAPAELAASILMFAFVALCTRRVSAASLFATAVLPLVLLARGRTGPVLVLAVVIAVLITLAHRDNIRRLLAGTEPPFRLRRP
jgi:glycerol-3-phosphate acyltransferase PlsY